MKALKISSSIILGELEKNTKLLQKSSERISSGKILKEDSPSALYLARRLTSKFEELNFISQHITGITNILQKYEESQSAVLGILEKLKSIAERASQANSPDEFRELENTYKSMYVQLKVNLVRKETFFGRAIGRGGFSNSVVKVENISGEKFIPTEINVSGLNFKRFGIEEFDTFSILIERIGNSVTAQLEIGGVPVFSETSDLTGKPPSLPSVVNFEELGINLKIKSDQNFSARFFVRADPILSILGDDKYGESRFFLPSLEPEDLGVPQDFSESVESVVHKLEVAISRLSESRAKIGERIEKLKRREDLNFSVKQRYRIFIGDLEDSDIPSESVILNLKQTIMQTDTATLQRAIANLTQGMSILMRR